MFPEDQPAIAIADRDVYEGATALIATFGSAADIEAANRASESRAYGNVAHFCRWRRVERLISILSSQAAIGTIH